MDFHHYYVYPYSSSPAFIDIYEPTTKVTPAKSNLQNAVSLINAGQVEEAQAIYREHLNKAAEYIQHGDSDAARKTFQLFLTVAYKFDDQGLTKEAQDIYSLLLNAADKLQNESFTASADRLRRQILDTALKYQLEKGSNQRAEHIYEVASRYDATLTEADCWANYLNDPNEQNLHVAVEQLVNAAQSSKVAMYYLGKLHFDGAPGIPADYLIAAAYINKSAANGNYLNGYDAAIQLRPVVAQKNVEQGQLLEDSNPSQALKHFQSAARAKNLDALLFLGRLYLQLPDEPSAIKVEKKVDQAITYLQDAADQKSTAAALLLGKIYAGIINTGNFFTNKTDPSNALVYFGMAKKAGDKEAAFEYLVLEADYRKIPNAMLELGKLYLSGEKAPYPKRDHIKAEQYLKLAAQRGLVEANYLLGSQYKCGNFKSTNPEKDALEHYQIAVNKGYYPSITILKILAANQDPSAQWELYRLYNEGSIPHAIKKDVAEAETNLMAAAINYHVEAVQKILGLLTSQASRQIGFQAIQLKNVMGVKVNELIRFYSTILADAKKKPTDPEVIARQKLLKEMDRQRINQLKKEETDPDSDSGEFYNDL